jgi:hypothetical protein
MLNGRNQGKSSGEQGESRVAGGVYTPFYTVFSFSADVFLPQTLKNPDTRRESETICTNKSDRGHDRIN